MTQKTVLGFKPTIFFCDISPFTITADITIHTYRVFDKNSTWRVSNGCAGEKDNYEFWCTVLCFEFGYMALNAKSCYAKSMHLLRISDP
jgi:hypothetical protein